jgi:hypothetical protein
VYSPRIVEKRLDAERIWLRRFLNKPDFEFVRHSPSACQQWAEHMRNLIDDENKLKRDLNREEVLWALNERSLCRCDYIYFSTHYAMIETADNRLVLYQPTTAQIIQNDLMSDLEEQGRSIELQILKARQTGQTTDAEIRICQRVNFYSNVNAVVASSDPGKSALMAGKMETVWDNLPWPLLPKVTRRNVGKLLEFGEQNSAVSILSGAAFHGVARGQTPTAAHCSECSEWNDPAKDIDDAMLRAMHPSPELFVVLESTALCMGDWWEATWKSAKAGKSRLTPRFYPWYTAPQFYPTPTWLKAHPVPVDWTPTEKFTNYAEKCRRYVLSDAYLVRRLGSNWQLSREELWWYYWQYEDAKVKHAVNALLRELPADEDECWSVTGISILDPDLLETHSNQCKDPIGVYGFVAMEDVIRKELQANPADIDPNAPPIEIDCEWLEGHRIEGCLMPLRDKQPKPIEEEAKLCRLFLWEWPRVGHHYGIAIDSSEGLGLDQTAIECLRRQTVSEVSFQAAELACLAEGSPVIVPDGLKPIESINPGEYIITRLGTYGKVAATRRIEKEQCVELRTGLAPGMPLFLTPEHLVATESGWREAGKLKRNDWLIYPVRPLSPFADFVPIQFRYGGEEQTARLDANFGFFCGIYLAEGSACGGKSRPVNVLRFTLHRREVNPWAEIMQKALPGVRVFTHPHATCKNAGCIDVNCRALAQWIAQEFGRRWEKRIPAWVWNAPREFVEGLARGMMAGDGSISGHCWQAKYGSTVPRLVVGLRDLVMSLGWGIGVITINQRKYFLKNGLNAQPFWSVSYYRDEAKVFVTDETIDRKPPSRVKLGRQRMRWGWDKHHIYYRVTSVRQAEHKKFVDLHVEGIEPSFCVPQAVVHNSNVANAVDAVNLAMLVGALFSPPDKFGNPRQCKIIAERRSESDVTQLELRKHGWSSFHQYVSIEDVRLDPTREHKLGWMTTAWSRRRILAWLLYIMKTMMFQVNSKLLLHEFKTLHLDPYEQKIRAERGGFDDRLMATAIAWYTLHELDNRDTGYQLIEMEQQVKAASQYATYPEPPQEEFQGWGTVDDGSIYVPQSAGIDEVEE